MFFMLYRMFRFYPVSDRKNLDKGNESLLKFQEGHAGFSTENEIGKDQKDIVGLDQLDE